MTDEIKQVLKGAVGGQVCRAATGAGSFLMLDIQVLGPKIRNIELWINFATWALLMNEQEVLASDMTDTEYAEKRDQFAMLDGALVKFVDIRDGPEIHIGFIGQRVLEIWPLEEAEEGDRPMVEVYLNERHVGDIEES